MRRLLVEPHPAILPALLFIGLAAILVRILPAPHSPLHYLIAGTLATTGALAAVFLRLVVLANRRHRSQESHLHP
jgi:hypothetical protein